MSLENFMRAQISSAMAALKIGMDILFENEHVGLDKLMGHGGLFKTPVVGQRLMAGAMNVPVTVMETAGEGGPYGMALLAAYRLEPIWWPRRKGRAWRDFWRAGCLPNPKAPALPRTLLTRQASGRIQSNIRPACR